MQGTKTRIEDLYDRLVVTVRPGDGWGAVPFLCLWLAGWTAALVAAISALPDAGAIASLCFLLPTEGLVMYFIAWLLFGRTVLTATVDGFELERAVGRYVRSRRFEAPLVDRVGVTQTEGNGYRVRISYRGEDVNLLSGLSGDDAKAIASSSDALLHPRSWWDADRPQTPLPVETTPSPRQSARRRNIVGFAVLATCFAIGVLISIRAGTNNDSNPHAPPTAVPQTGAMPRASNYPNPTAYAIASTSWMLDHGPSQLVMRPRCDPGATWTHWSCTAIARTNWLPQSGRALPYRCEAAPSGGFTCRLDTK